MTPHQKLTNERSYRRYVTEYLPIPPDGKKLGINVFKKFYDKLKQEDDKLLNSFPQKTRDYYVLIEDRHDSQAILQSQYLAIADTFFHMKIYAFFSFAKNPLNMTKYNVA